MNTKESYYVVDDVIDEAGREGYEVMFGNPHEAVGVSRCKCRLLREARTYIRHRLGEGDTAYRVKLARRHGEFSCKPMKLWKP